MLKIYMAQAAMFAWMGFAAFILGSLLGGIISCTHQPKAPEQQAPAAKTSYQENLGAEIKCFTNENWDLVSCESL